MGHSKRNVKQARRLGVTLPDTDAATESLWTSDGHDTIYDGKGGSERVITRDPRTESWTVRVGNYRYAEGVDLETAMEVSRFLARRANRAAWRGVAPKAHAEAAVTEAEASAALKRLLAHVNSGAVKVS